MCRSAQGYGQDLAKEGPRASAAVAGLCVRLCVAVHVRGTASQELSVFDFEGLESTEVIP